MTQGESLKCLNPAVGHRDILDISQKHDSKNLGSDILLKSRIAQKSTMNVLTPIQHMSRSLKKQALLYEVSEADLV